jgi:hypothetical protein
MKQPGLGVVMSWQPHNLLTPCCPCACLPAWLQPDQPGFVWRFNPEYWARHATKDWSVCPDLYSTKDFVVAVPKVSPD